MAKLFWPSLKIFLKMAGSQLHSRPAEEVPGASSDGDGKADPCVVRRGAFLCDIARDGNAGVTIAFGQAGDVPLLGDFDGDGRADPCVSGRPTPLRHGPRRRRGRGNAHVRWR
jgi:hypothetical protein